MGVGRPASKLRGQLATAGWRATPAKWVTLSAAAWERHWGELQGETHAGSGFYCSWRHSKVEKAIIRSTQYGTTTTNGRVMQRTSTQSNGRGVTFRSLTFDGLQRGDHVSTHGVHSHTLQCLLDAPRPIEHTGWWYLSEPPH